MYAAHAYVPTTSLIDESCLRVYAAFVDQHRLGRVGYVDVEARDPLQVLEVSERPALDIGVAGSFDEHGVTPTAVVAVEGGLRLYYIGWQRTVRGAHGTGGAGDADPGTRYRLMSGAAESRDGGVSFTRVQGAPLLGPRPGESVVRSVGSVVRDGPKWRMWYASGDSWVQVDGKSVPTYGIRHLESADGLVWEGSGAVCLEPSGPDEFGFGRPFVRREGGDYRMWYSIRTHTMGYRLGYAESPDGLTWARRDDQVGIGVSDAGWDSEMVAFACAQNTPYGEYLFYNGNGYGETGFGVAVRES